MSTRTSGNQYFACLADGSGPIAFQPPSADPVPHPDAWYFARALAAAEPQLASRPWTFYLTWNLRALPAYGANVVALVLGDEPARIPPYFHRVAATFKSYGTLPALGVKPAALPSRLGLAAALELAEKLLICAPGAVNFAWRAMRSAALTPPALPGVFPIPIGYFRQLELPVLPILERPVDVFFAGSVRHFTGDDVPAVRRVIPSAKTIAREEMVHALEHARRSMPSLSVDLQLYSGFAAGSSDSLSTEEYSRRLMASRICLAPRGNSVETFRILEGMRYGCVVLCDPLPRRWFYRGAPVVTVTRWRDLPRILSSLLSDERGLVQRHEASLAWWRDRCSERALGNYMADRINRFT